MTDEEASTYGTVDVVGFMLVTTGFVVVELVVTVREAEIAVSDLVLTVDVAVVVLVLVTANVVLVALMVPVPTEVVIDFVVVAMGVVIMELVVAFGEIEFVVTDLVLTADDGVVGLTVATADVLAVTFVVETTTCVAAFVLVAMGFEVPRTLVDEVVDASAYTLMRYGPPHIVVSSPSHAIVHFDSIVFLEASRVCPQKHYRSVSRVASRSAERT